MINTIFLKKINSYFAELVYFAKKENYKILNTVVLKDENLNIIINDVLQDIKIMAQKEECECRIDFALQLIFLRTKILGTCENVPFEKTVQSQISVMQNTLSKKSAEYDNKTIALKNINDAKNIANISKLEVVRGYMRKHFASVYDIIKKKQAALELPDKEIIREKFDDFLCYLAIINAIKKDRCDKILDIEEGVKIIPRNYRNYNLQIEFVNIPNSVIFIGENAFSSCKNLEKVYIGTGCKYIENFAFFNCRKLEQIILPTTCRLEENAIDELIKLKYYNNH